VDRHVAVPLLETVVLANVVQVVTSDDSRALHLQLHDDSGEDAASDRHIAGERALLVNVASLDRLQRGNIYEHVLTIGLSRLKLRKSPPQDPV